MAKKIGLFIIAVAILASPYPADAQQPASKIPRIGFLALGSRTTGTDPFLQGLKDLGYVEGQNMAVEHRFAEGKEERLTDLATELVQLKVDVIVVGGTAAARAVRRLTKTIPIVVPDSADPVAAGLVATLSRPAGNITGLTIMAFQLGGKRLELLKETLPSISRVVILVRGIAKRGARDSSTPFLEIRKEIEVTARSLGVQVQDIAVGEVNEIENAFSAMTKRRADAFILIPHPMFTYERKRVVDLASKSRLPAIYPHRGFVEAGGLMSYAANPADLFRRAASFVDKILKGANPADLPIEQPTKFELVINLKTAKQIGVTIPPDVLMWADEVIK
jgi:putative tryptophan/tyrosine transport system substrate-binding protein